MAVAVDAAGQHQQAAGFDGPGGVGDALGKGDDAARPYADVAAHGTEPAAGDHLPAPYRKLIRCHAACLDLGYPGLHHAVATPVAQSMMAGKRGESAMGMLAAAIASLLVAWMAQAVAATLLCAWYLHLLRRPQPAAATLPPVLVLVPVRGPLPGLEGFLAGLAAQDHPGPWRVVFAVEDAADPAHAALAGFVAAHPGLAALVLAGPAVRRGQKVENLLAALGTRRPDDAVVVTLDADIRPPPELLRRLVRPLLSGQAPLSSGYRWTLPGDPGPAALLVALADAGIATLPRCARCNLCWGGATALRLDALALPPVWDRAVSDDLALTRAARDAGLTIYAPLDVRPPSPVSFPGFPAALGFGARQYRVLRLHAPRAWGLALLAAALPVAGGAAALLGLAAGSPAALGCLLLALALQRLRARLRHAVARRVLPVEAAAEAGRTLRRGAWLQPLVPAFQLACLVAAAGGGRWLDWAGRRYAVDRAGRVTAVRRHDATGRGGRD